MAVNILQNALICDHSNQLKCADIYFADKIIDIKIKQQKALQWQDISNKNDHNNYKKTFRESHFLSDCQIFEADGLLCIPGALDAHVHFNTPGFEFREDFEHASCAAACGGVTTVIDMPCTSIPPVTSAANLQAKLIQLENRSLIDYALWGGVSANMFGNVRIPEQEIVELTDAGVVGFKTYLMSGMPEFGAVDLNQLLTLAKLIGKSGLPLAVHAENHDLVTQRQARLEREKKFDWQAYCESRDVLAEAVAAAQIREIAASGRCRMHIVHLSSQRGVQLVRDARAEKIPLTAETCPHYLTFTQKDFARKDISAYLKTAPPVKHEQDRQELWEGLRDGTLSFVTTDHAGCNPELEKSSDNFWEIYGGIPGVQHRVPFLFSEGFKKGLLTLQKTIELLATNAAEYFGIARQKGSLKEGKDADFILMNLWKKHRITSAEMQSKGKYTPFEGMTFNATVEQTWLRGKLIARQGQPVDLDYNYGQWLKPSLI